MTALSKGLFNKGILQEGPSMGFPQGRIPLWVFFKGFLLGVSFKGSFRRLGAWMRVGASVLTSRTLQRGFCSGHRAPMV